ncbi:RNA polymerase sigma factor [Desulfovibrio psychrotolerans]|uniref:DNA-directed RNA polymerase sigma-70 factor n=1 Tax=Desulfovibrio psychrotolerans TaxID=415242 RepID=A0A7J0BZ93_9BACT|nr:RNA polymerase sigma factor [Desulfovibrio psychrotolerans]GFM38461.1 hypothetical protein DSM19430T_31450 [Desulfovibrio psychrotolerans]
MKSAAAHQPRIGSMPSVALGACQADITACLMGDRRAWQEFVSCYKQHITRVVSWTLRRHSPQLPLAEETDDVVQEVFMRLIRGNYRLLESWNPQRGTFSTWLTVVSRSTALDTLRNTRSRALAHSMHLSLDECPELLADVKSSTDALHIPEGILTPRQKSVLLLMFEKDMTAEEIAAFLDISPQTVRSTMHSAILRLREQFIRSDEFVTFGNRNVKK